MINQWMGWATLFVTNPVKMSPSGERGFPASSILERSGKLRLKVIHDI